MGKPREHLLGWWAGVVCDHPWMVLSIALVLAVGAVTLAATRLEFQSKRNALIDPELEWNKRFIRYREQFEPFDSIGVVVAAPKGDDGRQRAEAFINALAPRLEADPNVRRVVWGYDPREASAALIRLLPYDEFERTLEQLAASRTMLEAKHAAHLIETIMRRLNRPGEAADRNAVMGQIEMLTHLMRGIERGVDGELDPEAIERIGLEGAETWRYLTSQDGDLYFLEVHPALSETEMNPYIPAVDASRRLLGEVRAEFPGVEAGLTGVPVMESDETKIAMSDSTRCSIIAVIAIAVLLTIAFHGWRLPVLAVIALMIAVAWSYGFVTLAIGHLQVLSVVFTVILLGLGIDFGIHLLSRFEQVRHDYPDGAEGMTDAIADALQKTGPGIITGAVTTGIAFGTTLLTQFTGMAEMGLIAGVGVMLCLVSMLGVLPALMRLGHMHHAFVTPIEQRRFDLHGFAWLMPFVRHPWWTVSIATLIAALSCVTIPLVGYDNDLTNLLPEGMESVVWQEIVLEHSDTALWYGAMIAEGRDEARRLTEQARRLPMVADVGGAGLLFPRDEETKLERIRALRDDMGDLLTQTVAAKHDPSNATALRQRLQGGALALAAAARHDDVREDSPLHAALSRLGEQLTRTVAKMNSESFAANAEQRMATMHEALVRWQDGTRRRISAALQTDELTSDQLPPPLRAQLGEAVDRGLYLVKAYPSENVWDPAKLAPFVEQLRRVDPDVTGTPVQIYESGLLIQRSYFRAGWMALIAVFVLVLIDFRSLLDAVLCLVPVTIGFVTMFAALWLVDVPINPANIIVLPLLFGIGVDSGVHVLHRYRQDRRDRPAGLAAGTGKGVVLTSLTTLIGFSVMMTAQHRGIQSLGLVLTVGIAASLLACLIVMPAILEIRNRNRARRRLKSWSWSPAASSASGVPDNAPDTD